MRSHIAASSLVLAGLFSLGGSDAIAAQGCINPALVSTVAGQFGLPGNDDGPGTTARLAWPAGAAGDLAGNIYVASGVSDSGRVLSRSLRKIAPDGTVSTVAGNPNLAPALIDGLGSTARFGRGIAGLAVDGHGNIYVADTTAIRLVTPQGRVATVAGSAMSGWRDGPASTALFTRLEDIALDGAGNVYVTDYGTVRKLTPAGVVSTLAGAPANFGPGSADGFGTAARFSAPSGSRSARRATSSWPTGTTPRSGGLRQRDGSARSPAWPGREAATTAREARRG